MLDLKSVRSSTSQLDRLAASRDLWPGGTLEAWQGGSAPLPERVLWPTSAEQVQAVLEAAAREAIAVVPYGAGSGVCGGARGRAGSWVLDTKGLSELGTVDPQRWSVQVGAGVIGQQLEDWLEAQGYTLGHSPSSISCSTVGGWAAARSAGQFSSRYGVFEDMILSLEAVAPGVGRFTVGQGGTAPDGWMDQLLGSEGTLAIVTRATLRVWPTPQARWLRGYRFASVPAALEAMRALMQGELHPSVVRLYDPVDTRIGGKTRPRTGPGGSHGARRWLADALARIDQLPGVRARSLVLPLALPRLLNRILDRLASGCLLIVGWEGAPEVVDALSSTGHRLLCELGDDLGAGPGQRWYASRHAVSYKLMPIFERGGFADTMEVAARWSDLEGVYHAVRRAIGDTAVVMAHMSHVYPEGGCIYFSFAGRGDPEVYRRTWSRALAAVLDAGGTLSHHHGVGSLKADAAAREVGPAIAGWRALKAQLDPAGILNPGRLFGEVSIEDPGPPAPLRPGDQLARSLIDAGLEQRRALGEPLWPYERLPGLPRWQRNPWQTPWVEVAGEVDGRRCLLGRGPRSAVGPDLRPWLAEHGGRLATWAVAVEGPRWLGEARPEAPWAIARQLLRSDLRPAVLSVVEGALRVGFRGPAAAQLGAIASELVPGGLEPIPWAPGVLPSGPLEPCEIDDPGIVHVTPQGAFRRIQ